MDRLNRDRLSLLTLSQKMILALQSDNYKTFSVLNNELSSLVKDAQDCYGDQISDVLQQLIHDYDQIENIIKQKQVDLFHQNKAQLKNIQKIKSYI